MNDTDRPDPSESAQFLAAGYKLDSEGRPLHPLFQHMATDPEIGVVTGKGAYWNWGPNYTADSVIITESSDPKILLIQRGDTGAWALPGGFVDPGDTDDQQAAVREVQEEAGVSLSATGTLVYRGVVGDLRTTAHAWAETSAYLFTIPEEVTITGQDDAVDARWHSLETIDDALFGSHAFLIKQALDYRDSRTSTD
jgi:8-oxo-dGTP pyrophosphatase MutT (NUDIX family)